MIFKRVLSGNIKKNESVFIKISKTITFWNFYENYIALHTMGRHIYDGRPLVSKGS